jgi:hypothetical protein
MMGQYVEQLQPEVGRVSHSFYPHASKAQQITVYKITMEF